MQADKNVAQWDPNSSWEKHNYAGLLLEEPAFLFCQLVLTSLLPEKSGQHNADE